MTREDGSEDDASGEDGDEGIKGGALRIEAKTFAWFISDGYLRIKEYHRKGLREICFSKDIADWVCVVVKEKSRFFGRNKTKVSRQFESVTVSVIEGSNCWGFFLSIQVKIRSSESNFIIIPAGFQGCNWESFALWLGNGISNVSENGEVNVNSSVLVGKHCSYADVLKSGQRVIDSDSRQGFVEDSINTSNQPDLSIVSLEREIRDLRMQLHRVSGELSQFRLSKSVSCSSSSSLEVNGNGQAKFVEEMFELSSQVAESRSNPLSFEELCGSPMVLCPSENIIRNMSKENLGYPEKGIENVTDLGGAVKENNATVCSRYSELAQEVSATEEAPSVSKEESTGRHFGEEEGSDNFEFQNSNPSINGKVVNHKDEDTCSLQDLCVDTHWGSDKIFDVGPVTIFNLKVMLREVESSMDFDNLPLGKGRSFLIEDEYFHGATIFHSLIPPAQARVSKIAFKLWRRQVGRPLLKTLRHYGVNVSLDLYDKAPT